MVETSARCSMIGSLCEESGATGIGTQLLLPHVVVTYVGVLAAAREDEAADATSSVVPLPRERVLGRADKLASERNCAPQASMGGGRGGSRWRCA